MATLSITIPDEQVDRIREAFNGNRPCPCDCGYDE